MSDLLAMHVRQIDYLVRQVQKVDSELSQLSTLGLPRAMEDEERECLQRDLKARQKALDDTVEEIIRFPPYHGRHKELLSHFWANGRSFEKSVFIMTKYPEGETAIDEQLSNVINTVSEAVKSANCVPRIALDGEFHPSLWDNVELHLLGCSRGIAIVEDRYRPELNPNVAMEWGWMRGMGRPVLFLMEEQFIKSRADWGGLVTYPFHWERPEQKLVKTITHWLKHKRLPLQGAPKSFQQSKGTSKAAPAM